MVLIENEGFLISALKPLSHSLTSSIACATAVSSHVVGSRHAYIFLLQLSADDSFMGCTPEKLFKLEGDQLSTEALAGTRPRGDTAEADQRLAHEV